MSALKICPQCGTEYELDQRFCPKDGSTLKLQGGQTGDLVGSIIADRYNVMKKLGEGGMGTVYLAEHVKMGRKSALKVMNPGMVHDADAISRFNREAANASRINHPNVASVYDFGETSEGLIYLAMEFIEGPSLTKVIEEAGALPPARAAEITRQAADALAVAHDMGIVHRDLKPDNIMLAKNRDGSDLVKVVDFGIAKAAADDKQKVTKTGLVVGTPEYMSPEQLAGDKLDGRSDTYSLALVAFAMFTGKLPFPADTVQESMILRLTDQPKRLYEMKGDVSWPEEVQTVMDKALERDAAARYQSASEFGRALHKAVMSMPEAALTNAFTAVMGRMSTPKAPVPGAAPTGATKPMPATRVNPATPVAGSAALEPPTAVRPEKSRTGMYAGIGGGLIAVAVGGWFVVNSMNGSGVQSNANGTTSGATTTAQPAGAQTTPATPQVVNYSRELDRIADMPDSTRALSDLVVAELARLEPGISSADDPTFLRYRFLRGKALYGTGKLTGCDSILKLEGDLRRSDLKKTSSFWLDVQCKQ